MTEKQRGLEELLCVAHDTVAVTGVQEAHFCHLFSLNSCVFSNFCYLACFPSLTVRRCCSLSNTFQLFYPRIRFLLLSTKQPGGTRSYILWDQLDSTFLTEILESIGKARTLYEGSKLRRILLLTSGREFSWHLDNMNSLSSYSSSIFSRI